MKGFIVGLCVGLLMGMPPVYASLDDRHPAHERAEDFVCERPWHAERAHGLTIMPEACDD